MADRRRGGQIWPRPARDAPRDVASRRGATTSVRGPAGSATTETTGVSRLLSRVPDTYGSGTGDKPKAAELRAASAIAVAGAGKFPAPKGENPPCPAPRPRQAQDCHSGISEGPHRRSETAPRPPSTHASRLAGCRSVTD